MDFAARRAKARKEMAPHLAEVERRKAEAVALKDKLAALRKANANDEELASCRDALSVAEKAARESQSKADVIDAAVYDLKAVNPRARVERDTRTPAQIIESIANYGRTVESALARLRELTQAEEIGTEPGKTFFERTPEERAQALLQWAESPRITAPPLSDEAISRESIYGERDVFVPQS